MMFEKPFREMSDEELSLAEISLESAARMTGNEDYRELADDISEIRFLRALAETRATDEVKA